MNYKKNIFTLIIFAFFIFLTTNIYTFSNGIAGYNSSPPNLKSCTNCHSGTANNADGSLSIKVYYEEKEDKVVLGFEFKDEDGKTRAMYEEFDKNSFYKLFRHPMVILLYSINNFSKNFKELSYNMDNYVIGSCRLKKEHSPNELKYLIKTHNSNNSSTNF